MDNDPQSVKVFGRRSAQQLAPGVARWVTTEGVIEACWSARRSEVGSDADGLLEA